MNDSQSTNAAAATGESELGRAFSGFVAPFIAGTLQLPTHKLNWLRIIGCNYVPAGAAPRVQALQPSLLSKPSKNPKSPPLSPGGGTSKMPGFWREEV